jgi:two-component system, response regulator YesN
LAKDAFKKEVDNIIKGDKYLKSFSLATGIDASIYRYGDIDDFDMDKDVLDKISTDSCCQNKCKSSAFCRVVQRTQEGKRRCSTFRQNASIQCISISDSYITRCHAGLTLCFAPMVFEEKCVGAITCGPFIMWDFDDFAKAEAEKLAYSLDIDSESLLLSGELLIKKTSEEVGALADMLFSVAEQLAVKGSNILNQNLDINYQQARIAELLHKMKQTENRIVMLEDSEISSNYPLQKEKELIGLVKIGDRNGAKTLLNEILVHVFYYEAGNLDVLKARVLELVVVISRAAVESGAGLKRMLGINFEMILAFAEIDDFTEICTWVSSTLDEMMDTIYNTRDVKNLSLLTKSMEYIRTHYSSDISLEDVAKHAVVSESHISHIFGKELGVTFSSYLTKVRIENAKKLLLNTDYSVLTISDMVGYDQPGYFSKVFKKYSGKTPGKFRRGD